MEEENRDEIASNQVEIINNLIKEEMETKETIEKLKNAIQYWKTNHSTLANNIWANERKNEELLKREAKFREAIAETAKIIESKEQELKDASVKRILSFSHQCDEMRKKGGKFAESILRAQIEYSNENLSKDASKFREEFATISNELPKITNKFSELKTKCKFNNNLNLLEESEEMSKINVLLTNIAKTQSKKSEKINEARETLSKLRGKVKQKQMALKSFKDK